MFVVSPQFLGRKLNRIRRLVETGMAIPTILLVDDDWNLLRVLVYQVGEFGYRVLSESSPRKAMERFDEELQVARVEKE